MIEYDRACPICGNEMRVFGKVNRVNKQVYKTKCVKCGAESHWELDRKGLDLYWNKFEKSDVR